MGCSRSLVVAVSIVVGGALLFISSLEPQIPRRHAVPAVEPSATDTSLTVTSDTSEGTSGDMNKTSASSLKLTEVDFNEVNISWLGRIHGSDIDAVEELQRIPVTDGSPCTTLLHCVAEVATFANNWETNAVIIVATGRGKSAMARIRWRRGLPVVGERRHRRSPFEVALHKARNVSKPTLFYMSIHDIDLFGIARRQPVTWKGRAERMLQFRMLFFLHCSPIVMPDGRMAPRVIPIPHQQHMTTPMPLRALNHSTTGNCTPFSAFQQRPRYAVWRGATTGAKIVDMPPRIATEQYQNGTDRGRVISLFARHPHIGNVFFSQLAQGIKIDSRLFRGKLASREWHCAGRVFVDVDGNSNAWEGLRWKLHHGGPILKINSTELHVQWYYHMLQDRVHLRHVDLDRDDVIAAAVELLDNVTLAETLMRNAVEFARTRISVEAAIAYMEDAVARCWENAAEFATRDWRIRSLQ